jgi:hypothetical protein
MTENNDPATAATVVGVGGVSLAGEGSTDTPAKGSGPLHGELLTPSDLKKLSEYADSIRSLAKRNFKNTVEMGRLLTEARKITNHGYWLPWLQQLGLSPATAFNVMNVYEKAKEKESKFSKFENLTISVSCLYLLAHPSTPPEAHNKVIEQVEAGKTVTVTEVKNEIAAAKGSNDKSSGNKGSGDKGSAGSTGGKRRYVSLHTRATARENPQEILKLVDLWKGASSEQRSKIIDSMNANDIWCAMGKDTQDVILRQYERARKLIQNAEMIGEVIAEGDGNSADDIGIPPFLDRSLIEKPDDLTHYHAAIVVAKVIKPFSQVVQEVICQRACKMNQEDADLG